MKISKFRNAYEICISAKANTLEFETDHHTTYEIYTAPGLKIIPGFVFSSHLIYVGFCPKGSYSRDAKVIPTIMNFILDLFEDKNAIIAYIHSSEGDLHKVRENVISIAFTTCTTTEHY